MHKLFARFRHKNEKVLRRELALAHMCIALLSLAMVAVLSTVYDTIDDTSRVLVVVVNVLLVFVALISASIVYYINRYGK
ncbi:MAG: hypothetical protein JWO07_638 [Candidatus Saccharibacteria bacterium]|nr:hypothetical protein [Candidatus Saccharibacteria bacterium]